MTKYPKQIQKYVDTIKEKGIKVLCVTGASRAGKDTFVNMIEDYIEVDHFRPGDNLKLLAHQQFDQFPPPDEYNNWSTEQREEKRWNGLNSLDVLIKCIDPMRLADPYVFLYSTLASIAHGRSGVELVIVSGCRTREGLDLMHDIGATFVRLERPDSKIPESATLDDVQVIYPVNYRVVNTSLDLLRKQAFFILNEATKESTAPEGVFCNRL